MVGGLSEQLRRQRVSQRPVVADSAVASHHEAPPAELILHLLVALFDPVTPPVQAHHLHQKRLTDQRVRKQQIAAIGAASSNEWVTLAGARPRPTVPRCASNDQSRGIVQVNHAIVQIDQMTQQNAALVEQAAAAADSLQTLAGAGGCRVQDGRWWRCAGVRSSAAALMGTWRWQTMRSERKDRLTACRWCRPGLHTISWAGRRAVLRAVRPQRPCPVPRTAGLSDRCRRLVRGSNIAFRSAAP